MTYAELTIAQGTGDYSNDALISVTATSEYLAVVEGLNASVLNYSDFASTATGSLTLTGTSGNDTLLGASGADNATTGTGTDIVVTHGGDDNITIDGVGDKTIDGGTGTNTLSISYGSITGSSDVETTPIVKSDKPVIDP